MQERASQRARHWLAGTLAALALAAGLPAATAQDGEDGQASAPNAADTAEPTENGAAEQDAADADREQTDGVILPETTVIGSDEGVREQPGSGYYVDTEEIRQQSYDDINRILRRVPGVYVREEDGYGLFPNISLRGVDPARSAKVTIMEDGILQAPAPYSAPSAYYSPTAGRMDAIEILKGSSQVRYGPHTTGGVINYLSTPIPEEPTGYIKTLYGEDNEFRAHAHYGATIDMQERGRFGFLIEGYHRQTDGFKEFAPRTPDLRGDDTGFTNTEPMVKLMWEPDTEAYQRLEFKYGYTDREANETYLGLSESDFSADPSQRYPASRFDDYAAYQNRTYLKHYIELNDQVSVQSTAYYNKFHRNWFKLGSVNGNSPSRALAAGGNDLAVLKGQAAGSFNNVAGNRDYYSWGAQIVPRFEFELGQTQHELEVGLRYHNDRIRRFQWSDDFTQNANGAITSRTRNPDGSAGNRRQETSAIALHARDDIRFDRWTVTPGIRVEHLDMEWTEFASDPTNTVTDSGDGTLNLVGGGVGVAYDWSDQLQLFGGVHQGFSPPGPRTHLRSGLDEETSLAFEAGARYQDERGVFTAESTAFYTRFDDLIAIANVGGAATGSPSNVGRVDSYGLEMLLEYDAGRAMDLGVGIPSFLSFTYTDAELANDVGSNDPGSLFAGGRDGAKVPYIPEYLATVGTGIETEKFDAYVTGSFVDEVFTTASNTSRQVDPNGNPDARFGKLDSHFIVDLSAHYRLNDQATLYGGVHNLLDEEYTASRLPHGPRPGKPRFTYVGLQIDF